MTPNAEAFLFTDMVEGITHFVETTGAKAEKRLTAEEAAEIEFEERSLPPLPSVGTTTLAEILKAAQPTVNIQNSIAEAMKAA